MTASGVLWDHASKLFRGTIDFQNGSAGSEGDEKEDVLLMGDERGKPDDPADPLRRGRCRGKPRCLHRQALDDEMLFICLARGMSAGRSLQDDGQSTD